jgi:hypothetical protein
VRFSTGDIIRWKGKDGGHRHKDVTYVVTKFHDEFREKTLHSVHVRPLTSDTYPNGKKVMLGVGMNISHVEKI